MSANHTCSARSSATALFASLALAGCTGALQPGSLTTGSVLPPLPSISSMMPSSDPASGSRGVERIGSNLYRVSTTDRRHEDAIQRENYALLRAAETTQEAGGTHFILVTLGDQAGGGGSSGARAGSTLVRVLTIEPGGEPPVGAVSASEMIQFFGPTFGRPPAQTPWPPAPSATFAAPAAAPAAEPSPASATTANAAPATRAAKPKLRGT